MIVFASGSGAQDFDVLGTSLSPEEWEARRTAALRLLRARSQEAAAELLETYPFAIHEGSNFFSDDFAVLYASVTLEEYVEAGAQASEKAVRDAASVLAKVLTELGPRYIRFVVVELDTKSASPTIGPPSPDLFTSQAVTRALADAENLLRSSGPVSAVDRVHTALHGYIRHLCAEQGLNTDTEAGLTTLFKTLRSAHPAFAQVVSHDENILRILNALAAVVESINQLRNRGSLAHPNPTLLGEPEAHLALNAARTVHHYVSMRVAM